VPGATHSSSELRRRQRVSVVAGTAASSKMVDKVATIQVYSSLQPNSHKGKRSTYWFILYIEWVIFFVL